MMNFLDPVLLSGILLLWISLSVHEWAHARAAYALGDDTAKMLGRMTLDPLAHIDWIGTFLLPLLGVPFGWAKPVPINPTRFRRGVNMDYGMMLTAAAGPASNVVLAAVFLATFGLIWRVAPGLAEGMTGEVVARGMLLNVMLAIFNILPIPPLDGSRVAAYVMPDALKPFWYSIERAGIMVPFLFMFGLRMVGIDLFYPFQMAAIDLLRAVIPG